MEQHIDSVRKTFKYKLKPTPAQERALETVLWRCRTLYNTALEERKTAWERCQVSVSYYQQKAELPDLMVACPEYCEVNAQVLQDVILRVERAFQAFFRRVTASERAARPSPFPGAQPLPQFYLSAVRQHRPASEWKRSIRRIRPRIAAGVGRACPRV